MIVHRVSRYEMKVGRVTKAEMMADGKFESVRGVLIFSFDRVGSQNPANGHARQTNTLEPFYHLPIYSLGRRLALVRSSIDSNSASFWKSTTMASWVPATTCHHEPNSFINIPIRTFHHGRYAGANVIYGGMQDVECWMRWKEGGLVVL